MKYNELSKAGQDAVYDDFIQSFDSWEWGTVAEDIIDIEVDNLTDTLKGYNIKINYTGFYSQGDGACFTGFIGIKAFIENCLADKNRYPLLWYIIQNNDLYDDYVEVYSIDTHHSHEKSVKVGEVDLRSGLSAIYRFVETEIKELQEDMQSWVEETSKEIYKRLKDDYESSVDRDDFEFQVIQDGINYDEFGIMIEEDEEE